MGWDEVPVVGPLVVGGGPEVSVYGWRTVGWGRLSSRNLVVRSAALVSLRGMGRPCAVRGASETGEVLGLDGNRGTNRRDEVDLDEEDGMGALVGDVGQSERGEAITTENKAAGK